jgi:DNA-binding NarL/FixJ family response regulator
MTAVRFLIADDIHGVRVCARQLLEGMGFDPDFIQVASTPQEATDMAAELRPDFLLTDWFPKESMSGIALYQSVSPHNPMCRFALLSRETGSEQRQQAELAGSLFLLGKPFSASDLKEELTGALEQLVPINPRLAQHLGGQQPPARVEVAPKAFVPVQPLRAGDRVQYQGRLETVKHVIFRQGDLMVQLQGVPGMIHSDKLHRHA